MKFRVSYAKKQEFEIKELTIGLEISEGNTTDHPATYVVKALVGGVVTIVVMALALAVYGADHGQPRLFELAERILEIPNHIIDTGRDLVIHLKDKR